MNTDVIIIGAGAAGLMAACCAGEAGLNGLLIERRHRPGLKLLLCGNNRCNLSHSGTAETLIQEYGEPVGSFLSTALQECPPAVLRKWFGSCGLATTVLKDRIYPRSGKADDVLHCFTDRLRDLEVPLMLNCPAQKIAAIPGGGFEIICGKVRMQSRFVLVCTGGVSYPKTGSVGDGQRMAGELGLRLEPYRAGLAGIEVSNQWLQIRSSREEAGIPSVRIRIFSQGREIAGTEGNLLASGNCLRGSAIFDATRILARRNISDFSLLMDLFPDLTMQALAQNLEAAWRKTKQAAATLNALGLEHVFSAGLSQELHTGFAAGDFTGVATALKAVPLEDVSIRPLKEAIVTIGGVALDEIDPQSMESRKLPGLFFAGEVLDIDGPTGGYNLHAAFASARLAIRMIAGKVHSPAAKKARKNRPSDDARKPPNAGKSRKAAWGKKFWDGYLR
ncbi:MAG: aminoacetone oxidase family FAD-binding enzyme [Lentisphaerae bacterium]|nr:aminoacetone oxidase family FAD-binding enzyme [Lentisphaerota bacterium]